jgi:hypothetical protein
VGGEPLERCPPQRLLLVVAIARAWGGSWSGAVAAHDAGWSSEQPPGRRTTRAEPWHGVIAGAVTNGDREREERTRCSADQARERRGSEQVRRRGGERDKDIVWIRMRGGDFFCFRAVQNFVRVLARVPKFLFGSGWLHLPIQKIKAYFW